MCVYPLCYITHISAVLQNYRELNIIEWKLQHWAKKLSWNNYYYRSMILTYTFGIPGRAGHRRLLSSGVNVFNYYAKTREKVKEQNL